MQKYRLYPAFFTQGFLSSILAMDKKATNYCPTYCPHGTSKHTNKVLCGLCVQPQRWFCWCMAIIQESLQIKMLEEGLASFTCADCVFLLFPCGTTHTLCTSILSADDPREKSSVCAVGQFTAPKEHGANHCLHCTPRISLQRLLAASVASPSFYLMVYR